MPPDLRPRIRAWRWWDELGAPLLAGDPRLVAVPSIAGRGCLLHWYAAGCFAALSSAALRDLGVTLLAQSGHRLAKPWQATEEDYEAELLRRYRKRLSAATRDEVIAYGKLRLARRSTHETGLVLDLGNGVFRPDSAPKAVAAMRADPLHAWLDEHGPEHGWRRYAIEEWHIEAPCSREVYESLPPEG